MEELPVNEQNEQNHQGSEHRQRPWKERHAATMLVVVLIALLASLMMFQAC